MFFVAHSYTHSFSLSFSLTLCLSIYPILILCWVWQVVNFATEFIKYKEGGKRSQIISDIAVPEAGSGPAAEETGFISASKKKKPSK